jgi:hypothetical protein
MLLPPFPRLRPRKFRALLSGALLVGAAVLPTAVEAAPAYTRRVLAQNLLNPRGLSFDLDGKVLVVEGGAGGPTPSSCTVPGAPPGPPTDLRCWGKTGALGRFNEADGSYQRLWTGLDSIARGENALSPVAGLQDVAFRNDGSLLGIFGFRGDPATRPAGTLFAHLVQFDYANPGSDPVPLADLGSFESTNPSHSPPFSNPFALAWHNGQSYITDAGSNRLFKVDDANFNVELLENLPLEDPMAVPGIGEVRGEGVPTGLAVSGDGKVYYTQLPGFPFTTGSASIFRSDGSAGSAVTLTDGFTNVMDMALGEDGWLYLVQYAESFFNPLGTGSLWRYDPITQSREQLVSDLNLPTGVLVAPSGTIYVSTGGSTTAGELLSFTAPGPGSGRDLPPDLSDFPADPVPGPLPVAGGLVAWRQARRLRQRHRGVPHKSRN